MRSNSHKLIPIFQKSEQNIAEFHFGVPHSADELSDYLNARFSDSPRIVFRFFEIKTFNNLRIDKLTAQTFSKFAQLKDNLFFDAHTRMWENA
jgi:hypothetical protein